MLTAIRLFLIFSVFAGFTFQLSAEAPVESKEEDISTVLSDNSHRIGVSGSAISGYGLSYLYKFQNGFSLKSQLLIYKTFSDKEFSFDKEIFIVGGDLQYDMISQRNWRLYLLTGMSYGYYEYIDTYLLSSGEVKYGFKRSLTLGSGAGTEIKLYKNFTIAVEAGFFGRKGFNSNYDIFKDTGEDSGYTKDYPKFLGLGGGIGIYFAF